MMVNFIFEVTPKLGNLWLQKEKKRRKTTETSLPKYKQANKLGDSGIEKIFYQSFVETTFLWAGLIKLKWPFVALEKVFNV